MSTPLPERLRRSGPPLAATAIGVAVLAWLAFQQAGYFDETRSRAAAALWVALGVLCVLELPRLRLSSPALVALASLALLTAWAALSTSWSLDPIRASRQVELDLFYVAIFAVGLVAAGTGRHARAVLLSALALCAVVMGAALWARLHPGAFGSPLADESLGYRMDWPFGYWNALGGLGAMGAVLATGFAADPRSAVPIRAGAAATSALCAVATYLTFSRGSIAALAVGLVVLVVLGVHRVSLVASLLVIASAVAVLVLRLETIPALTTDPTAGGGAADAGAAFTPVVVVVLIATAAAQAVLCVGDRSQRVASALQTARRPLAYGLGAVALIVVVGTLATRADTVQTAVTDTGDWINRQWDEFNRPGQQGPQARGSARLDTTAGTRSDLWSVAGDGFASAPVRGTGAGSYQVLFFRDRSVDESVQNAHSLPYETLSELGLVGAGLLLTFLGAIVVAGYRSRKRRLALPTSQTAAAGAAVAVWLVHAAVDWDWQMPAFTGLALLIAAPLFPAGRRKRRRRELAV